jgi:hypothetical protein
MKKIGFVILAVVLALGAMGAGYAAWQQTLDVNGTATVATFSVYMTNGTPTKPSDATDTTIVVSDNTTAVAAYNSNNGHAPNAGLNVVITKAVPGTYTIPNVVVHNASTIPVSYTVGTVTGDGAGYVNIGTLSTGSLAAGAATTGSVITITIPDAATQGHAYTFTVPVLVAQQ